MLTIKLTFEKETGLDAIDPLGDVTISDGVSAFTIRTTYLDSWLAALISGYDQSCSANSVTVEVSEEPKPIKIMVTPTGLLTVSYENQALEPQPAQDLKVALQDAAKDLLKALNGLPNSRRNAFLAPIRKFVSAGNPGPGTCEKIGGESW